MALIPAAATVAGAIIGGNKQKELQKDAIEGQARLLEQQRQIEQQRFEQQLVLARRNELVKEDALKRWLPWAAAGAGVLVLILVLKK